MKTQKIYRFKLRNGEKYTVTELRDIYKLIPFFDWEYFYKHSRYFARGQCVTIYKEY